MLLQRWYVLSELSSGSFSVVLIIIVFPVFSGEKTKVLCTIYHEEDGGCHSYRSYTPRGTLISYFCFVHLSKSFSLLIFCFIHLPRSFSFVDSVRAPHFLYLN